MDGKRSRIILLGAAGRDFHNFNVLYRSERAAEAGVETVVVGTPIDLAKIFEIPMLHARARYGLEVRGTPTLDDVIAPVLHRLAVPL